MLLNLVNQLLLAQPSLAFSFRRAPRGGVEQEQFDEIVALVNDVILVPISDRWTWTLKSSGDFSVASGAEMSSHLFFSCCMVKQAVRHITCWWDVPYMEFESYDGCWLGW
ncbi:hypothetical protein Tco_0108082 [Tanacetum coccineum]